MAVDDLEQIAKLRETTRTRLRVLETQIAQFGEKWAPAHLITERAEAREALAKYETVLGSVIPTEIGDGLGAGGRFVLTLEEFKAIQDRLALFGYQFSEFVGEMRDFVSETKQYREHHTAEHARDRRWFIAGAVTLFIVAAFILGRLV